MNYLKQLFVSWLSIHEQVSFALQAQVLTTLQSLVEPREAVCTHSILTENNLRDS